MVDETEKRFVGREPTAEGEVSFVGYYGAPGAYARAYRVFHILNLLMQSSSKLFVFKKFFNSVFFFFLDREGSYLVHFSSNLVDVKKLDNYI